MQPEKLPAFITLWTTCSLERQKISVWHPGSTYPIPLQFNLLFSERNRITSPFLLCVFHMPLKNRKFKKKSLSKFQLQEENKNTVGVMLHAFKTVSLLKQTATKICPKVDPVASSLHSSNNKTHIWPLTFLAAHHLFPCVEAKDDGRWLKSNGSVGLRH